MIWIETGIFALPTTDHKYSRPLARLNISHISQKLPSLLRYIHCSGPKVRYGPMTMSGCRTTIL
jgi:hypothetical protein